MSDDFYAQVRASVVEATAASGVSAEDAFFEQAAERLCAVGELETADRAHFEGISGGKTIRVDGSGGDPREADGVLSVLVSDYRDVEKVVSIDSSDTKRLFGRLANFVVLSRREAFRDELKAESAGAGLAQLIADAWPSIVKIKLILVTNALYAGRADAVIAGTIAEIPVTYNVWDIARLERYDSSAQAREEILVDFKNDHGAAVPALKASKEGELESYLLVMPGKQLGEIYDRWGARLLESNVRSFLQAKGKVNQGIRDTIKTQPSMFFAFNNGLSATADSVETEATIGGLMLTVARNLQVVNGGQTTASIHAARRTSAEALDKVYVQVKLTVVPRDRSDEIVPRISQFANSQNKVSAADFFSNHGFHVRMEGFSRNITAPANETSGRDTKWFYERARGQYLVERAKRSEAERRRFDMEFPKTQFFTKTDLAKVEYSFACKPDVVSRGAQKAFAEFARETGDAWAKSELKYDETWYKRLVAKLIVFKFLENAIPRQPWYVGGYRANVVTYAIAKLCADCELLDRLLDLDAIWRAQSVPSAVQLALLTSAEAATAIISSPPAIIRNVTEWAKKQACWESLRRAELVYDPPLLDFLVEESDVRAVVRDTRREATLTSGIEAQTRVVNAGASAWSDLRTWAVAKRLLTAKEIGILRACELSMQRVPSEKQCLIALDILERAKGKGYAPEGATRVKLAGWVRDH